MSWNAQVPSAYRGQDFVNAVNSVSPSPTVIDAAADVQFQAAKRLAIDMARVIPGPMLGALMFGHANGLGEIKKPGMSNDYIAVTVQQVIP